MTRLTGTGTAVTASAPVLLAAGLLLGYPTLAGLGLAAGVALLAGLAATAVRPRVGVARAVSPERVNVGDPALITLTVTNHGRLPAPGFHAVENVSGAPLPIPVAALRAHQRRVQHVPLPTTRRGLLRLGPVVVARRDPFGLVRREQRRSAVTRIWVRPRVHRLPALPLGTVLDFEGQLCDRAARGSTTFSSLREYQPGDDPRQVHWPSTARLGTLVVRDQVDTTEPTTSIVLDARRAVFDEELFEQAVEVAASVAAASSGAGHAVHLRILGEDRATVREAGGHHVLDRLAAAARTDAATAAALVRLADGVPGSGALVVVTGDDKGLSAGTARLRRRHSYVVVVTLVAGAPTPVVTRRAGGSIVRAAAARDVALVWPRLLAGGSS